MAEKPGVYKVSHPPLNIKWGKGEEDGNFGEENKDLEEWRWGRISSCRELYTPLDGKHRCSPVSQRVGLETGIQTLMGCIGYGNSVFSQ